MLAEWPLDPDITYLNHGTVGVTPRAVMAKQQAIRERIARNPAQFMFRELARLHDMPAPEFPALRAAAEAIGARVGARGDDLVFVDNATAGVNAVLRSLPWGPGDEIVVTDHGYGALARAADAVTRGAGALVRTIALPRAGAGADAYVAAIVNGLGARTRLLIVDHVTSGSALVLPIERVVAECRRRDVPVLVDGAHVPGAMPLDIETIGADWYVANLHKWGMAPRSCGFLWAPPHRQSGLHPPVVSWGLDTGFTREFDWMGTRDPSPWLAAPAGFEFLESLGLDALWKWNHMLAWGGAHVMAARWGTAFEASESMIGCMATVPLPASAGSSPEDAQRLRDALLFEERIEVPVLCRDGGLWIRVCAQAYNEPREYERLAEAVAARRG
ncbi:MAG: aminotransferase class V-fold PLP-dependent enzyme [Candidatus Eisenbacteria bacterium]|uniref:Aminotransferase class V-fold PLP-dependent enzyme n=1 Tax=Eiseniibacteriota bacterium TaxID=2212470 RepID=A0A933WAF6_UNCEI|nr:aminotransferase class V-fold PLP-dependent enzyme [Candidatus Eisenbacteria bacterium]